EAIAAGWSRSGHRQVARGIARASLRGHRLRAAASSVNAPLAVRQSRRRSHSPAARGGAMPPHGSGTGARSQSKVSESLPSDIVNVPRRCPSLATVGGVAGGAAVRSHAPTAVWYVVPQSLGPLTVPLTSRLVAPLATYERAEVPVSACCCTRRSSGNDSRKLLMTIVLSDKPPSTIEVSEKFADAE